MICLGIIYALFLFFLMQSSYHEVAIAVTKRGVVCIKERLHV